MNDLASKKILLQSKGVKLDWKLEERLAGKYVGAVSDYMSFFMDGVPVGILNGFYTDTSPFDIRAHEEGYAIFKDGNFFHWISFIERPDFFDAETSKGTRMERLCKMVVPGFPIIYMNLGCMYWGPEQCRFCVVGYINTEATKDPNEVAEVVSAGVEEGAIKTHVALTSGALPNDRGMSTLGAAVDAIKDSVDIPVSVNGEPPRRLENLARLSGADSVYFNLEVYSKAKRKEILPGKCEFSLEYYDRVFEECFEYFDDNQVASVLLAGLEDDKSYLEGIEHLASRGVLPVPVPFYPTFHSKLEGVQPPSAERMERLYQKCAEIIERYGINPFKTNAGFMRGGAIFSLKEVMEGSLYGGAR